MSIIIRVFGPSQGCAKCRAAEKVAEEVAEKFRDVSVEKIDVFSEEADRHNIMMTPTIMVNEMMVEVGKPPSPEKLQKVIAAIIDDEEKEG
ncbi:MAG: thioredoxin family protein [Theionarchaea archaeon]|nr:thioredoxin family protein [Theionarchaea archaeon]